MTKNIFIWFGFGSPIYNLLLSLSSNFTCTPWNTMTEQWCWSKRFKVLISTNYSWNHKFLSNYTQKVFKNWDGILRNGVGGPEQSWWHVTWLSWHQTSDTDTSSVLTLSRPLIGHSLALKTSYRLSSCHLFNLILSTRTEIHVAITVLYH